MAVEIRVMLLVDLLERFYIKDNILMWKNDTKPCHRKDTPAGYLDTTCGYLKTTLKGSPYPNHRIMYQMYHGIAELPSDMVIDHMDRDRSNNSKENLQLVNYFENSHNLTKDYRNTSGYTGVSWRHDIEKWQVYIRVNNKKVLLGIFDDLVKAGEAYDIGAIRRDPNNHVLNFPEKKEKYLKYIAEKGWNIGERYRKPKGKQSGEKYINYLEKDKMWRTKIVKEKIVHQKHFPGTDEGLQQAIQWRDAKYQELFGQPFPSNKDK